MNEGDLIGYLIFTPNTKDEKFVGTVFDKFGIVYDNEVICIMRLNEIRSNSIERFEKIGKAYTTDKQRDWKLIGYIPYNPVRAHDSPKGFLCDINNKIYSSQNDAEIAAKNLRNEHGNDEITIAYIYEK